MSLKTDLILEVANLSNKKASGYNIKTKKQTSGLTKTIVEVLNKDGSLALKKAIGHYITIDAYDLFLFEEDTKKMLAKELSKAILELMNFAKVKNIKKVFVVGLGNKEMMSDSLGPKVVDKIIVTRHIKEVINEGDNSDLNSISALATGVLGTTGIETANIVKAVTAEIKPQVVIVVDTLSTLATKRLATSFQLSNGGIVPGGGVGNSRQAINEEVLGVPVIAIGVPLVVYAHSMCNEVLEKVVGKIAPLKNYEEEINKIATNVLGDLVVTIKDVDKVVENCADIIGVAINLAVNPQLGIDKIIEYMN